MAYINEFPNWDSNKLNLDWILEQYSTFNQRIQEIEDHFDEVAEAMGQEVEQLESDFNDFKTLVNNNMDAFELSIQRQLNQGLSNIQSQINTISSDMATYISEHMSEWQAEADYSDHVMKFSNEESPTEDLTKTVYQLQLDGTLHRLGLKPSQFMSAGLVTGLSGGSLQGINGVLLEGKGTYLVMMTCQISLENSPDITTDRGVIKGLLNTTHTGLDALFPLQSTDIATIESPSLNFSAVGIYKNSSSSSVAVNPHITTSGLQSQDSSSGAFWGLAIRICDEWSPVTT